MLALPNDENLFRMIFIAIFSASIAISGYHRIKARTGEPLARREEGIPLLITIRLAGLIAVLAALAYAINPLSFPWARLTLPTTARWLGAGIGILAPALLLWTLRHLGKNLTDTVVARTAATLVTTGPYRWVRHPFYVAAALLFASAFLITGSWVLGLAGFLAMTALAVRTPIEEQNLLKRFGEEYRVYGAQTGRFLPRLK